MSVSAHNLGISAANTDLLWSLPITFFLVSVAIQSTLSFISILRATMLLRTHRLALLLLLLYACIPRLVEHLSLLQVELEATVGGVLAVVVVVFTHTYSSLLKFD